MLDRIHAKNFRCYKDLDLDLTTHKVHCFYGPHGAGKSSVAMAVEVALTGKVVGAKSLQDMAEMIKDGAKSWTVDAHGAGEHAKRHRTRTAAARPVGYPWMSDNMAHAVFGPNQHILSMDSKVRRAFFYDALGVQVTAAGIKNRLGARGVDDTLAKGFAESAAEIGFKQAEGIAVDERRIAGRKRDEAEALKSSPSPVGWLGDLSKVDREELFAEIHTMADRRDVVLKKIGASEERELVDLGKLRASEEELQANIIVQEQLADPGVKDALDNDKAGHLGQIEFHRGNITNINDQIRQTNARVKIKRDAHQKFDKERRDHTDTLKEGMAKIIMVLDSAQSDHECPIYRKPCPADKVALVNAKALEHHRATIEADISAAANKVQASEDDLKVVIRSGKEEADGLREKQDPINAKIIDLQEQVNGIDVKLGAHRQAVTDLSDLKARIASVQIQIAKGEAQAKETVEDIDKLQVERDELDAKITPAVRRSPPGVPGRLRDSQEGPGQIPDSLRRLGRLRQDPEGLQPGPRRNHGRDPG